MEMFNSNIASLQKSKSSTAVMQDNRVKALKSLAALLLREVEMLEDTVSNVNENFGPAGEGGGGISGGKLLDEVHRYETDLIRYALIQSKGNQRRAAKVLGVKVSTLNAKIKRYGIDFYPLVGEGSLVI